MVAHQSRHSCHCQKSTGDVSKVWSSIYKCFLKLLVRIKFEKVEFKSEILWMVWEGKGVRTGWDCGKIPHIPYIPKCGYLS